MALSSGARLGPYEIVSALGAGGMGEVYKARDTRLDRIVAIKVVSSAIAGDPQWRERFDREARAISALNHPHICTLHDVGHQEGVDFLVMEYLDGESLADRLRRGALRLDEAVTMAIDLADGLGEAHRHGFIHRDIKPANAFITTRGDLKILDFGLAKVALPSGTPESSASTVTEIQTLTSAGAAIGTVAYMSPEQMRGLPLDHRTDLFSFGLVLYEMVTGGRAFTGSTALAVGDAILHSEPRDFGAAQVPARLKSIIWKLLEKDRVSRYGSAQEVCTELRAVAASLSPGGRARLPRGVWVAIAAVIVLAVTAATWFWQRSSRERWALGTATPEIVRLLDADEYVKAAALIEEARAVLPQDPTLEKLWTRATGIVSITSVPSEAEVSIRPYRGDPNAWQSLGRTPLKGVRVPRGSYLWRITKPGFALAFFVAKPPEGVPQPGSRDTLDRTVSLRPEGSIPPEMLVVAGGRTGLEYPLGAAPRVNIDDFLIDRYEVTNEQYKRFVDAGGYLRHEFWKQPFVRNGRVVPWEVALASFLDATGRPGPAMWEVGGYPAGTEKHPVAGVSWYEAAAFAEFVGKSLPTAYHWAVASEARGNTPLITQGSNFRSNGTQPVGSAGTLSGFGTSDMAGNVKEWCLNEGRDGKRFSLGGGFGEPVYMFNFTDTQSPWDRLANFGFRCAKLDSPPSAAATARIEVSVRDYSKERPVPDEVFKAYTALYAYDNGELNARVEETEATENGRRERVSFDAGYGQERVIAQLYLPRKGSPPFQAVVYFPGGFAMADNKLDLLSAEYAVDFLLKSGRAVIFPIYKGTYERQDVLRSGGQPPALFRDHVIAWSKDLGRSLDYLETRSDIDASKVGYFGFSLGGQEGALLPAVEPRIKAEVLSSGGFVLRRDLPEVDPFNFVTRVTIPVLMLSGRYDDNYPLASSQLPLFRLLGTPEKDKKHVIYEGGHGVFPRPDAVRETLDWLDKYLGAVRR